MTPEQVKDLEDIYSTVTSKGFKLLLNDVETKLEGIKEELTNPSVPLEVARVAQGRVIVYRELLACQSMVENALKNAAEDAADEEGDNE